VIVLGIDPGTEQSGWALFDGKRVINSGVSPNTDMRIMVALTGADHVAMEAIASYGMPVGREVFETCIWIGRFIECASTRPVRLIYRRDVKLHLCGSPKAKDGNIRQALLDKLGPVGTKKEPGPLYGVKSHTWAALAVAVTAAETPRV